LNRVFASISVRCIADRLAFWKLPAASDDLSWSRLFTLSVLAAYAYAFMEWLFFTTMPSFMDALTFGDKFAVFLTTGLVLAGGALGILLPLRILGWIPGPTKRGKVFQRLGAFVPAAAAAALSLLMIDNFTYTVLKFGIITSQGVVRAGYGILAVSLLLLWYRRALQYAASGRRDRPPSPEKAASVLAIGLLVASLAVGAFRILTAPEIAGPASALAKRRPHIILISAEGLDSKYMSLYGYTRDTTPNLIRLSATGLVAENNFTNAAHTSGSVVSMLTGKFPIATRMLYGPNILQGADALEHLPGILRRAGYTTVQIAIPMYVDAYNVNMQEAFDEVNGRSHSEEDISRTARALHWENAGYFLPRLWERIADRLQHIFFLQQMPDPYREVIQFVEPTTLETLNDTERLGKLMEKLSETEGPVFAHIHLMESHGPKFYPRTRVFSAGLEQDREWMQPFYDDAVRDFDAYIGELVADLETAGLWENTVLVLTTDHVDRWRANDRIPLFFHFPDGEHAGRIRSNTQTLDIAPTLLDYIGLETPPWMSGLSLLSGEPPALRPIFSAGVVGTDCGPPDWWCKTDRSLFRPPFDNLGYLQVVVCQEMDTLTVGDGLLYRNTVSDHTAPCPEDGLPSPEESRWLIIEHLRAYGFDVSSLE
jgi:phosphoglycerol transferase MdoB-like AlkP superfamily enzyme